MASAGMRKVQLSQGIEVRCQSAFVCPHNTHCRLVDGNDRLAHDLAVGEGDDGRIPVEPSIRHDARKQPGMMRTDITTAAQTSVVGLW